MVSGWHICDDTLETVQTTKDSVEGLILCSNQYGTDNIGRNPTDREKTATIIADVFDDEGILIAFLDHCTNAHDTQTVASTFQNVHTPICG